VDVAGDLRLAAYAQGLKLDGVGHGSLWRAQGVCTIDICHTARKQYIILGD